MMAASVGITSESDGGADRDVSATKRTFGVELVYTLRTCDCPVNQTHPSFLSVEMSQQRSWWSPMYRPLRRVKLHQLLNQQHQ